MRKKKENLIIIGKMFCSFSDHTNNICNIPKGLRVDHGSGVVPDLSFPDLCCLFDLEGVF